MILDDIRHTTYNRSMIRTQIYISEDLHRDFTFLAKAKGINFSNLVRVGMRDILKKETNKRKRKWGEGFIGAGGKGGPKDLSHKIDYYLYGGGSKWAKK